MSYFDNRTTAQQEARDNWILRLATAPAAEPVSAAEFKSHARIDHTDDDTYISSFVLPAARQYVEEYTRSSLIDQSWDLWLDAFPTVIYLPRGPVDSVTSITYTDSAGAGQTLGTAVYTADTDSIPARIYEAYGQTWPVTYGIPKAVKVRFKAGYGTAGTDCPYPVIQAIKIVAAELYENREQSDIRLHYELPLAVTRLLQPYRMFSF